MSEVIAEAGTGGWRVGRVARWLWRWRFRVLSVLLLAVVLGYATTCVAVNHWPSPTDRETPTGVAYLTRGDADAAQRVVLVHGAPGQAGAWWRLLRDAERDDALRGARFDAVDRLGYGNAHGARVLGVEDHARSLAPLLGEPGDPPVVLVGHSYGGPIVLAAAALFPERVGAVVVVAGSTDPDMQDSQGVRIGIDYLGRLVPRPWATANAELLALTGENRELLRSRRLDDVRCPVFALHGTWDPVCPHDGTVLHLRTALPNARVRVESIARAGHNLHLSHTDRVLRAIANGLDATR